MENPFKYGGIVRGAYFAKRDEEIHQAALLLGLTHIASSDPDKSVVGWASLACLRGPAHHSQHTP